MRTTLSAKGQVVIPRQIREALELEQGTALECTTTSEGAIVLQPVAQPGSITFEQMERALDEIRPAKKKSVTIEQMKEAVGEAIVEKWRK